MSKYQEIQTRKLVSAYGGVGSLIETPIGALKIDEFNRWHYFQSCDKGKIAPVEIEDNRLLNRLKNNFPKLEKLVQVPINTPHLVIPTKPKDKEKVAKAQYFPQWMYCSNCQRFKPLSKWFEGWKTHYNGLGNKIDTFTPPKCYECYKNNKAAKKQKWFFPLEQVRFIMTAPNGKIRDIPWHKWNIAVKEMQEEDADNGGIWFPEDRKVCCHKQDLRYIKSTKFSDLAGIRIECKNCKEKNTLSGLFGLRYFSEDAKDNEGKPLKSENGREIRIFFKPVIRSSNSVYYPIITNSLFLPKINPISPNLKAKITTLYEDAEMSIEEIYEKLKTKYDITISNIQEQFSSNEEITYISEQEYRLREYQYFLEKPILQEDKLRYEAVELGDLEEFGIERFYQISKLKLTSVQTGYSRQEPIDRDLFAQQADDYHKISADKIVKAKFTSTKGPKTTYLPAIESFGEGFFLDFNPIVLEEWFQDKWENITPFRERIESLQARIRKAEFGISDEKKRMGDNPFYLTKFILLHTLSHILIKELEFLVGYPATSINERLYIDSQNMQGILIYTIAGTEGSYGGLVRQGEPEKFKKILLSALYRAKDCASDPICYHSDGQGVSGLNMAACYSCTLLPETSCEHFNSFLDRGILVDEEYGYFK